MQSKLALFNGNPLIKSTFKKYNPIGKEEADAAKNVIDSGILSDYLGAWSPQFYGGKQVLAFEKELAKFFKVKYAITVNSWTSGLIAAVGALDIEPGDEIIVSPWTMCASATAILHWNAIPIFADIEEETFCICPESVEKKISTRTKAIMAIDIFGQSANMHALKSIAEKYNLKIISDTAQAPGALYHDSYAGTLADIGGYSLNYHKHIHTGEGGVLVTNDDMLAERLKLIRNHAEAVVEKKGEKNISNMLGYNFRLGEIECAIGREQLKKLDTFTKRRQEVAHLLSVGLSGLKGLDIPKVREKSTHVYYIYPLTLNTDLLGVSRNKIIHALQAEGVEGLMSGYQNIHLLPLFQKKIAYGSKGFPWTAFDSQANYDKGICPVAEKLHDTSFLGLAMCLYDYTNEDISLILEAFRKVWDNMDELKNDL